MQQGLLGKRLKLAAYVPLGYFIGWAAVPVVYAIVLTLITANLQPLGINPPQMLLKSWLPLEQVSHFTRYAR